MKELNKSLLSSFKGVLQGTGNIIRHPIEKLHRITNHISFWRRESTDEKIQDVLNWITTNPLVSALISGLGLLIFSTLISSYLESKKRKNEEKQEKILTWLSRL